MQSVKNPHWEKVQGAYLRPKYQYEAIEEYEEQSTTVKKHLWYFKICLAIFISFSMQSLNLDMHIIESMRMCIF